MFPYGSSKLAPPTAIFRGVITIFVLTAVAFWQWHYFGKIFKTESWPVAPGVIKARVDNEERGTGTVRYTYKVAGKQYVSNLVYLDQSADAALTLDQTKDYSAGQKVNVHYDPDKPELSVLRTGSAIGEANYMKYAKGYIIGLAMLLGGLYRFHVVRVEQNAVRRTRKKEELESPLTSH